MTWTSITIDFTNFISMILLYVEIDFANLYNVMAFTSLLVDVAETYGFCLTLLIFMLSQKLTLSIVSCTSHENARVSITRLYNTKFFSKLSIIISTRF